MPANVLEDLDAGMAELEAALSRRLKTRTSQVNATASMEAALTEALEIIQQLKVVVHNKVKDDDGFDDGVAASRWASFCRMTFAKT